MIIRFGASSFFEITGNPVVWKITGQLGVPPHFIYLLGVAKLSGIIVLLIPGKLFRLKEWVFAGIFSTSPLLSDPNWLCWVFAPLLMQS
jgi:hypothetical protein